MGPRVPAEYPLRPLLWVYQVPRFNKCGLPSWALFKPWPFASRGIVKTKRRFFAEGAQIVLVDEGPAILRR